MSTLAEDYKSRIRITALEGDLHLNTYKGSAAVLPGSVATEFGDSHRGQENSWMLAPEDVAEAVSSLVRYPERALPSRIELRPTRPPKK